MSELYLDAMTASIFKGAVRGLTFSASISVAITLRQSTGAGVSDFASGRVVYPETSTPLTAFRGIVGEKEATERIQMGTTWWALNPDDVASPIKTGDRITDADEVVWYIFEIGDPDPINALTRVYTRRSSAP